MNQSLFCKKGVKNFLKILFIFFIFFGYTNISFAECEGGPGDASFDSCAQRMQEAIIAGATPGEIAAYAAANGISTEQLTALATQAFPDLQDPAAAVAQAQSQVLTAEVNGNTYYTAIDESADPNPAGDGQANVYISTGGYVGTFEVITGTYNDASSGGSANITSLAGAEYSVTTIEGANVTATITEGHVNAYENYYQPLFSAGIDYANGYLTNNQAAMDAAIALANQTINNITGGAQQTVTTVGSLADGQMSYGCTNVQDLTITVPPPSQQCPLILAVAGQCDISQSVQSPVINITSSDCHTCGCSGYPACPPEPPSCTSCNCPGYPACPPQTEICWDGQVLPVGTCPLKTCLNGGLSGPVSCPTCDNGGVDGSACCNNNGYSNYPTCGLTSCPNGATNAPACDNICLNGYTNYPICGPTGCLNGATNPPTCDNQPTCLNGGIPPATCCGNGYSNYPTCGPTGCSNGATNAPTCDNICSNGYTNYPTCGPTSCINGATNPPACNNQATCTNGGIAGDVCCGNGYSNYPTCGLTSCPNGATNAPTCNNICSNGYSNYPTCGPTSCSNGAVNAPLCNQCPSTLSWNFAQSACVPCGYGGCSGSGGSSSNPTGGLTCKNGAVNPQPCDKCPLGYMWNSSSFSCISCQNGGCSGDGGTKNNPFGSLVCNNGSTDIPTCTPKPIVDFTATPLSVSYEGRSKLAWRATNADSCEAFGPWSNTPEFGPDNGLTDKLSTTTDYSYSCNNIGGNIRIDRTVSVCPKSTPVLVNTSCQPEPSVSQFVIDYVNYPAFTPANFKLGCVYSDDYTLEKIDTAGNRLALLSHTVLDSVIPITSSANYRMICHKDSDDGIHMTGVPVIRKYSLTPPSPIVVLRASPATISLTSDENGNERGGNSIVSWEVTYPGNVQSPKRKCTLSAKAVCVNDKCSPSQKAEQDRVNKVLIQGKTDERSKNGEVLITDSINTVLPFSVSRLQDFKAVGERLFTLTHSMDFVLSCGPEPGASQGVRVLITSTKEQ